MPATRWAPPVSWSVAKRIPLLHWRRLFPRPDPPQKGALRRRQSRRAHHGNHSRQRELPPGFTRKSEIERLTAAIQRALKRKGALLIPTFALGRTQEILALLALLMREGESRANPFTSAVSAVSLPKFTISNPTATHRQYPNLQLREALDLVVLEQGQAEK